MGEKINWGKKINLGRKSIWEENQFGKKINWGRKSIEEECQVEQNIKWKKNQEGKKKWEKLKYIRISGSMARGRISSLLGRKSIL